MDDVTPFDLHDSDDKDRKEVDAIHAGRRVVAPRAGRAENHGLTAAAACVGDPGVAEQKTSIRSLRSVRRAA